MTLPTSEPIPDENEKLPPARRRRNQRQILLAGSDERTAYLDELANRTIPGFDFFLFSILSGLILGLAVLLDSPILFMLAALVAPFMAPVAGLSLATILGSFRFFLRVLGATVIGGGLVFGMGVLAGLVHQYLPDLPLTQAHLNAQMSWLGFVVLTLGVMLMTLAMRRSEQKPLVPNVILAYTLYVPLGIAGFGLMSRQADLWNGGLVTFGVYLVWTILVGTVGLAIMGFHPLKTFGYVVWVTIAVIGLAILIVVQIGNTPVTPPLSFMAASETETTTSTETLTATITLTETLTPTIITRTPTRTLVPSETPTMTLTPAPTPVWAIISSERGVLIRSDPNSNSSVVASALQGSLVQVVPDQVVKDGGTTWVQVITGNGIKGWVLQSLLATATPAPNR